MCIYCGQLDRVHDFAAEDAGPGPQYVGPLTDYTAPATLPTFTNAQIIQALRTSFIQNNGTNVAPDPEDYTTSQTTQSWGRNGDIVYEVDTSTMSQFERARIDLAFEVWDDAIAVNIRNDQTAGDVVNLGLLGEIPLGPTRYISVSYVNSGTNAGQAFYNTTSRTQNAASNEYGTNDFTINTGVLVLGRSFNSGEFDGINNSTSIADFGVFDLTLFQQRGFETILHEVGHSLGLSHPGYYNNGQVTNAAGVRFDQDSRRNTIMSYLTEDAGNDSNADWNGLFAATPMVYDIAAVQHIYGADTQTRTGDTVYGFNNNSGRAVYDLSTTLGSVFTIWDSAGIDTLDASQFTSDSVINLTPGTYSSIGRAGGNTGDAMRENVGIAFGAWIERAIGGSGNDTITGNVFGAALFGRDGNDTLNGNNGTDSLHGDAGNDTLIGYGHYDTLHGGAGSDTLDGGDGHDTASYEFEYAPYGVNVDLATGKGAGGDGGIDIYFNIEAVDGSSSGDELRGDGNFNTLRGLNGNDVLQGRGGDDRLKGGGGDDVLEGGAGGDFLYGGSEWGDSGIDTVSYASDSSGVSINLETGFRGGAAAGDYYDGIERFVGSAYSDTMVASNSVAAHFAGGDGVDNLYGGGREDWLQGGRGADYINGGSGFDIVSYADAGVGITVEMYFTDGNTDGKILAGDWGTDTLVSIEGVEGSNFDDYMIGDERTNWFHGRDGNDYIQGDQDGGPQGSSDIVFGGAGNDTVQIGAYDSVSGDEGFDTATFVGGPIYLDYSTSTFLVGGQRINVFTGFESYQGTAGGDQVYGAWYGETISLGAGDDILKGYGGDDVLDGGLGFDTFDGGEGNDRLIGAYEYSLSRIDVMRGGTGTDTADFSSHGNALWIDLSYAGREVWTRDRADLTSGAWREVADLDSIENLVGSGANDMLWGNAVANALFYTGGRDTFDGRGGIDTVDFSRFGSAVWVDLTYAGTEAWTRDASDLRSGTWREIADLSNIENLVGTAQSDFLAGNAESNVLHYTGGRDTFDGRGGTDTADFSRFGSAVWVDLAYAGTEGWTRDRADVSSGTWREIADLSNVENLVGTAHSDLLRGNDGNNVLSYTGGRDTLDGRGGMDTADFSQFGSAVWVDLAYNRQPEEAWTQDTTNLNFGTWRAIADLASIENVIGTAHADQMWGDDNANRLEGAGGSDTLTGRGGQDTFVFRSGFGSDVVTDFSSAPGSGDVLEFSLGPAFDSMAEVLAVASQVGEAVLLNFGAGDQLRLGNTLLSSLSNEHFMFA
jgi:Ca2+-binding RTX toxin-like protein